MLLSGRIVSKDKKSGEKNGREWTCWFFTLEDGTQFSTFDTVTADLLPEENTVEVEVEKKGVFAYNSKNTTMYTSYAKDIFCMLVQEEIKETKKRPSEIDTRLSMKVATDRVKQAKEAFE